VLAILAFALLAAAPPFDKLGVTKADRPWLVVSDVHYMPYGRSGRSKAPSPDGSDTNGPLLDSMFAELARTEPDPPVVIIAGDFLGHGFPAAHAAETMAYLARRFDRAYPRAQFVITLGNNDSSCGDYESTTDGAFLRATARAWAPLVDRHGAAPDFVRTFSHDGGYVASLPRAGLRAVVVNDVYDTLRYRNACGTGNPAATSLANLTDELARAPKHDRTWLVMHVPPGIDAYSTAHLGHRLFDVPFMRPGARERLLQLIGAPEDRVTLVVAGHTHHFSFRLSDANHAGRDVPILIAPSISPIFGNAPSFLTLDVATDGTVRNVAETSYLDGAWRRLGDLAGQGVASFTAPELVRYAGRLERDPALRATYVTLYAGGGEIEIDDRDWPIYRCAIARLTLADFRACADTGGLSVLTGRGFRALGAAGAAACFLAIAIVVVVRQVRRRPPEQRGGT
jgi:predicted phosphodiesterase